MRAALYLRVSTGEQTVSNQRQALADAVGRKGWVLGREFADEGVSGSKGRERRPGFDALLTAVEAGEVDVVCAWSVDRLGRSLQDLLAFCELLRAKNCELFLSLQALDTTTAAGRAMFQMIGVFAEFERSLIVERVHAGLNRARADGKRLGRPKVSVETEQRVKAMLAAGRSQQEIRAALGCSAWLTTRLRREIWG